MIIVCMLLGGIVFATQISSFRRQLMAFYIPGDIGPQLSPHFGPLFPVRTNIHLLAAAFAARHR
jgi:hypothetical protein